MVKYTKIYMVSDLSPEDKTFLCEKGFKVYCSDDFEDLASNPKTCQVGILSMINGNSFLCHITFEDKAKPRFCWFKYIRIIINPYGPDEFKKLPSELDVVRIQFGKSKENLFERCYDRCDHNSAKQMILEYAKFYKEYATHHSTSARTWKFPVVYINDKPVYKVTPNGTWDEYKEN